MQVHPIGLRVNAGANSGAASTIGNSKLLLAYNVNAADKLVTIEDGATGNAKASFTLGSKKQLIVQKAGADEIFAESTDVKFTPVAYTN